MPDVTDVRVGDLHRVRQEFIDAQSSVGPVTDHLHSRTAIPHGAFGNGGRGVAAHGEYDQTRAGLMELVGALGESYRRIANALTATADTYQAGQGRALENVEGLDRV